MAWKRLIRAYFTFNTRERRGVYVLLVLLTTLLVVHAVLKFSPPEKKDISLEEKQKIDALAAALISGPGHEESPEKDSTTHRLPYRWKAFDPNTVDFRTLVQSGLDTVVAARLVKYREKGGKFRNTKDLEKIYGIDTSWLDNAHEYLRFGNTEHHAIDTMPPRRARTRVKPPVMISRIELNSSDSAQLRAIPGIGAYYAREIIALRNSLQGFRSYDQLLDVYNMSDRAMENLMKYTTLDSTLVSCIDLNTCSLETLGRHPYLTWKQARIIINYRQQHGAFRAIRDILRTDVIPDSVYRQVAPYLCVQ